MILSSRKYAVLFIAVLALVFLIFSAEVFATVTITTATGGSAISADTAGGTYTSLTGPVITEGATADIGTGTIILNAPSGFVFDAGAPAPTVLVTRIGGTGPDNKNINDLASGSTIAVTATAAQLTITITGATSGGVKNSLTWQNVRMRPSAGMPLASGNITKTGTSTIAGVTGSSNFGSLIETTGAKTQLIITTQPSVSATADSDFTVKPAVAVRDQFGNTLTSDSSTVIIRTAVLSIQLCGGTAGSGTLSSTPASGAAVTSGVMIYTAMQYSAAESIKICFESVGLSSALSDAITVSAAPTPTPTPTPTPSETPTPTPTPSESPPVVEEVAPDTSGGGNSPARIIFSGEAFPGVKMGIHLIGTKYGDVLIDNEFIVGEDGKFSQEIISPVEEQRLYGLFVKDRDGNVLKSKFFNYKLRFNTIVHQQNIIFAPTISINKIKLAHGELFFISGYAAPNNKVEALIDGVITGTDTIDRTGLYRIIIDTQKLSVGAHRLQTRQDDLETGIISDVSNAQDFRVVAFSFTNADFNGDNKINVQDWSIFLNKWFSPSAPDRASADLNGDGKINLGDFSLFLMSFQLSRAL